MRQLIIGIVLSISLSVVGVSWADSSSVYITIAFYEIDGKKKLEPLITTSMTDCQETRIWMKKAAGSVPLYMTECYKTEVATKERIDSIRAARLGRNE